MTVFNNKVHCDGQALPECGSCSRLLTPELKAQAAAEKAVISKFNSPPKISPSLVIEPDTAVLCSQYREGKI